MTPFLEWREAMFKVGLCSITFRQLSVAEVIDISKKQASVVLNGEEIYMYHREMWKVPLKSLI